MIPFGHYGAYVILIALLDLLVMKLTEGINTMRNGDIHVR